jgi:hypothetical protein
MRKETLSSGSGLDSIIKAISRDPIVFTQLLKEIQGKDDQRILTPIKL